MDLFVAMSVMALVGMVALECSRRHLCGRARMAGLMLSVCALAATACVYFVNGWLTWAKFVPLDAAIVWTNFAPLLLFVSAGAAMCLADRPLWRRMGIAGLAILFAAGTLAQPVMQPILKPVTSTPNTVWLPGGVCQQTSTVTCSPAAAVTLLKAYGMPREERQLIRWCLTDSLGTTSLGLWRGLRLATNETHLKPVVMEVKLKDLLSREARPEIFPCLILVGFPRFGNSAESAEVERLYTKQYGWPKGFRHSVVLFGPHPEGGLDVGDPSIGRERWSEQDLRVLWRGEAVRLVERG